MREIVLIYSTDSGSEENILSKNKISFGRGSDADQRFEDDGLSRLHATIYREDENIWIVDENSSNGTFVNGEKVGAGGIPLKDGDKIKIGHYTNINVEVREKHFAEKISQTATTTSGNTQTVSSSASNSKSKTSWLLPIVITSFALLIIGASVIFIAINIIGKRAAATPQAQNQTTKTSTDIFSDIPDTDNAENSAGDSGSTTDPTADAENPVSDNQITPEISENTSLTDSPIAKDSGNPVNIPSGKKYLQMSDEEKRRYIAAKALRVAQMIGNLNTDAIPPLAVERIKGFADAYASRANVRPLGGCRFGDNLQTTYERASKNAPFINRAFKQYGIDPQIGLYLAMIESEHCICLQSPTGPLGMFQFTRATGANYGLSVRRDASPTNGDERCEPPAAATAAAKYMKFLTGRYGTGPSSVPLAIGSYNSGEGGLSVNLKTALESNQGLPRDFWTLIANGDKLSKQFQSENFKYVPKFFAAAIVGENPKDFGLNLRPLSTYSN